MKLKTEYRVLALDIDGTLLNPDKVITKPVKESLIRWQKSGGVLVLASGRPAVGMFSLAEELELAQYGGYLIAVNGAQVIDCKQDIVISSLFLPQDRLPDIFDAAKQYGVACMAHQGKTAISESPDDYYVKLEAGFNCLPVKAVADMNSYVTFPLHKCLMVGDGDYLATIEPKVKAQFPDLEVYRSDPFFLEVLPKGVDKAKGLEQLLLSLQLSPQQLVVCGDGYNDLTMIRYAGLGAAMGNAAPAIQQEADTVIPSNQEDGVAWLVDTYLR